MRTYVASDWHLGSLSPPQHSKLAATFLQRIADENAFVVLNGDIFEGLFEPIDDALACQRDVFSQVQQLQQAGQLRLVVGNHDPTLGEAKVIVGVAGIGRVLIAHGHAADPWQRTPLCQLGDAVSRRFGKWVAVRGAAHLVESITFATVGRQVRAAFQARCSAWVRQEHCQLGVFGHVHEQYLEAGNPYANAGWMDATRLQYLMFDANGPHKGALHLKDI